MPDPHVNPAEVRGGAASFSGHGAHPGDLLAAHRPIRSICRTSGCSSPVAADSDMRISDWVRDVIRTGGEWISSVELENRLLEHPDVGEVTVVGIADTHWDERPLPLIVPRHGREPDFAVLRAHLPDGLHDFGYPSTGVGPADCRRSGSPVDKKRLRDELRVGRIEVREDR